MVNKRAVHIEKEIPDHWFRSYLYEDPIFVLTYKRMIEKLKGIRNGRLTLIESDDPMFDDTKPTPDMLKFIDIMAKKFLISRDDIYCYEMYLNTGFLTGRLPVYYKDGEQVVIRIYPENRIQDIQNVWADIQGIQKDFPDYTQRVKPPENPSLIYAIYSYLRNGNTMKDIYRLYENNDLKNYTGNNKLSEEEFKRYYNKFR